MKTVTCIEVIISIENRIIVSFPYSGNVLSIHGNTSMADYDSMIFFAVYLWNSERRME
jgi:hypothetical protein